MTRTARYLALAGAAVIAVVLLVMAVAVKEMVTSDVVRAPWAGGNPDAVVSVEPSPSSSAWHPRADQFKLAVETIDRECFGQNGCVLTLKVTITDGPALPEDSIYQLSYAVFGIDNEPKIGFLRLTGGVKFSGTPVRVDAPENAELTVEPVEVY